MLVCRNGESFVISMFKYGALIAQVSLMHSRLHFYSCFYLFTCNSYNISKLMLKTYI